MLLSHDFLDTPETRTISDVNHPQKPIVTLVTIEGVIHINTLSEDVLQKIAEGLGIGAEQIFSTRGRTKIYKGSIGFLLPTKYKTLDGCRRGIEAVLKNKINVAELINPV